MKRISLLLLAISSFTISSCQKKTKKYNWIPTECAPVNYPAQIFKGNFYYGDKGDIYIPDGREINYGWGEDGSINIAGDALKEAPETLELTWISFTENKNYTGKFELDIKKIDSLLTAGYPRDIESGKGTYRLIKVGMAPGGDVIVWLTGVRNKQVEVGFYKARPTGSLDWKEVYPDMRGTFEPYINTIVSKLPDSIKNQIKNHTIPFNYWSGLRKRYNWKPAFRGKTKVTRIDLDYFNKERDFVFGENLTKMIFKPTAVIEALSVYWLDDKNRELLTEVKFNEKETFAIFSKLQGDKQGELVIAVDKEKSDVTVKLKLKDSEIPFQQIRTQSFYK